MLTHIRRAAAWLAGFAVLATPLAQAGPVTLDSTFSGDGKAVSNFRGLTDDPVGPVRDGSGRWLFTSVHDVGGSLPQVTVTRLTATGALDATFGDGGIATLYPTSAQLQRGAIALDRDGRILVAFTTVDGCNQVGVARLLSSGAIDTGFGTGGRVLLDPTQVEFGACGNHTVTGIASNGFVAGADYRIVVGSTSSSASINVRHGTLTQLIDNGARDLLFGNGDGVRQLAVGSASAFRGVAYSGNRIYAWGSRTMGGVDDTLVARFLAGSGEVDSLFGSTAGSGPGYVVSNFGAPSEAQAFVETTCPEIGGGCFYLAGRRTVGGVREAYLARYISQFSACVTTRGVATPCLHNGAGAFSGDGWLPLDLAGATADDDGWSVMQHEPGGTPASQVVTIVGSSVSNVLGTASSFAARYLADGSVDTGFAGDGLLEDAFGSPSGERTFGALDANGGVFLLSRAFTGGLVETLAGKRLPNGNPDAAFGNAGQVRLRTSSAFSSFRALALDAGRPLAVGSVYDATETRFKLAVARFTANGLLDVGFGSGGQFVLTRPGDQFAEGNGVAMQADGRSVIAGTLFDAANEFRLTLFRLASNGTLDASFGSGGLFRLDGIGSASTGRDVVVDANGRLVVLGVANVDGNDDVVVAAVDATGTLDPGFGTAGVTRLVFPGNDSAAELRAVPGGYVVLGSSMETVTRALLARLDANGTVAWSVRDNAIPTAFSARALAVDAGGNLYVGGQANSDAPLLARFTPLGVLDAGWGNNGLAPLNGLQGSINAVDLEAGGAIVASGQEGLSNPFYAAYRVLPNGSALDTEFDVDGRVSVPWSTAAFAQAQVLGADGSVLLGGNAEAQFALAKLATRVASSVTLSANPTAIQYNQGVAFTAIVSGGAGTPSGNVEIFSGATSLGAASLDASGQAVLNVSNLEVGSYSLTARYAGNGTYAPSTSNPALAFTVSKASTVATIINNDPDGSTASGQDVSFTFNVAGAFGTVPTGSVTFFVDGVSNGDYPLFNGTTTISTDDLDPGVHQLHIVYLGDQRHAASAPSNAVQHSVGLAASGTSLQVSPSPSAVGEMVTLTAQVGGQAGLPLSGDVEFRDNGVVLATRTLNAQGQATFTTNALAAGDHPLDAAYLGSASYVGSASSVVVHNVGKLPAFAELLVAPSPSAIGETVMLSVTVTGSAAQPTGSVAFFDGMVLLGTSALANGQAAFSTAALAVGTHSLTAVYSGDAVYASDPSDPVSHAVEKFATVTTLLVAPTPSSLNQAVTLTATVTQQPGFAASGTIEFRDGPLLLATVPVSGGQAQFTTSDLDVGTRALRATYSGDGAYLASQSSVVNHDVNRLATVTTLQVAPTPQSSLGQTVVLTATVAAQPGTPATGNVEFRDGATVIATVAVSNGVAAYPSAAYAAGSHSFTATYLGDGNYTASTSDAIDHVVFAGLGIFGNGFE